MRRLIFTIPVLFGVSLVVFLVVRLAPGDPAKVMAGEHASAEFIEAVRTRWGLDKPLYVQYGIWLSRAIRGDLGLSIATKAPVLQEVLSRFPATLELSLVAMLFATVLGIAAGVLSATRQYSLFDYLAMTGALVGISIPVFWLGLMLMLFFGLHLDLLPISGRLDPGIELRTITGLYLLDA
ncbi:MAG: ABC transporter permease, partial [Atribacterota bacterium]